MKVLLINDCKFESFILKDLLSSLGCNVRTSNEYDAIRVIEKYLPDIVIANLIMRNTTGDELIKKIRQKHRKIKCILSSSNIIDKDEYNVVDSIIHTPTNKDELKDVIDGLHIKEHCDKKEEVYKYNSNFISKREFTAVKEERKIQFCSFCGGKLKETNKQYKFCPYCGEKI